MITQKVNRYCFLLELLFPNYNFIDTASETVILTDQSSAEDDLSKFLLKKLTLKNTNENSIEETKKDVGCYGFASRYKNELINSEVLLILENPLELITGI